MSEKAAQHSLLELQRGTFGPALACSGLWAVNAMGTQLRHLMNLGTDLIVVGDINKWTPPRPDSVLLLVRRMSRLTRDETAGPVSRDQILRRGRVQGNIQFPC